MGKVDTRTVTPAVSALRNLLLGRKHNSPLRFGEYYAPRTQPPPDLPPGPHSKLADNYYYSRDGRRETAQPLLIAGGQQQLQIQAKRDKVQPASSTPGSVYNWD